LVSAKEVLTEAKKVMAKATLVTSAGFLKVLTIA
jgi:hypothetical protein